MIIDLLKLNNNNYAIKAFTDNYDKINFYHICSNTEQRFHEIIICSFEKINKSFFVYCSKNSKNDIPIYYNQCEINKNTFPVLNCGGNVYYDYDLIDFVENNWDKTYSFIKMIDQKFKDYTLKLAPCVCEIFIFDGNNWNF